ncbi:hypothetical protein [Streptomyces sp. NPDC088762]|uniref:hypothetical protein n=1 Tax=Streptomyces sp. NPDC088762 TaxID=3365891 RepID=UPI0037FA5E7F
MITEPELDGEWEPEHPAEPAEPGEGPVGRPPARPWLWALGGAVLASAVWAGGLTAQNRFAAGPRIDYRHSENLCQEAPLTTLGTLTGGFEKGLRRHSEGPALDWSYCTYDSTRSEDRPDYHGQVQVHLHKQTDPGPEFGAAPGLSIFMDVVPGDAEEVPGLGERALISGQAVEQRLQVLDGGAVFTLTVQAFGEDGAETDEVALKSAMIEDMRALMLALKK